MSLLSLFKEYIRVLLIIIIYYENIYFNLEWDFHKNRYVNAYIKYINCESPIKIRI
ncbi:protein of unknown function [Methanocaldococcus lauensis]|uniref:Uncharacterized protein n=1 Tax=Methanocaldococcus lauensis TaxID=2546128 RepID=A0A8D6T0A6_9EURY|nr:protein of unknown function [Methanocaldococcus lauensis]CAB3289002.1 protein of unknown function [Methanocaldococcus lauensis]